MTTNGHTRLLILGVVLVGSVLAGCRTYGAYGNRQETLEQMRIANEVFAEELQRARADLRLLEKVAEGDSALQVLAGRYRTLVLAHEAMLAENHDLVRRIETGNLDSYRTLNRTFGAILSRAEAVRDQYADLRASIAHLGKTPSSSEGTVTVSARFAKARYTYVPLYYHQVSNSSHRLTMREALRMSGRLSAPSAPEAPELLPGAQPRLRTDTPS